MSVIVDDRDASVKYPASWRTHDSKGNPLGKPVEYKGSSSLPGLDGDSAEFTFNGYSIAVYGTMGSGTKSSSMNFNVDNAGSSRATFSASNADSDSTTHHQLFYSSPVLLEEGVHTLSINSSQSGGRLFLDYILYNTSSTAGKMMFIDDTHPNVQYSPTGWQTNTSESYFQHSARFSENAGAWVSYTFNGTLFSLYAPSRPIFLQGNSSDIASVSIDGAPALPIQPPSSTLAGNVETFNNLIYTTQLPSGEHTVNFTSSGIAPFSVDYFLVTADSDNFAGPPPRAAERTKLGAQASRSVNIAAVVGGIIAGVVVLLLLLAFLLLWRRRRRRRQQSPSNTDFMVPAVSQWAGKSVAYNNRDSMATLTNPEEQKERQAQYQQPKPGTGYLYYPES
ncbi:hypothetical protein R3P38DRAFT_2936869 [Favolaschia claudopus]|uniref:Transmembrane protein n=1 Tax=Favolaschia claudopus TaxID=2862362 RepID=A0AAW0BQV1_9AGAR